jgi:uncharacterized protein (TIGR02246 family)
MRALLGLVAVAAVVSGGGRAAPVTDSAIRAEVLSAYVTFDGGWRAYDADKIVDSFADDFEWTNEVGLRFTDKTRLKSFLTGLFKQADFRAGAPGRLVIRSIRPLSPDVAVVSSSEETTGQVDPRTGKPVASLHTNELAVLQRQGGRWLIVSVLDSDESHGI